MLQECDNIIVNLACTVLCKLAHFSFKLVVSLAVNSLYPLNHFVTNSNRKMDENECSKNLKEKTS